ncbi:MAG: PaaI family thioesterase [Proteobacteria bacterium]|nr:PaaI family thioesterase [Pseudomonadota bacterium]
MGVLTAKNPDYDSAVRDSFSRQPFMETVGADLTHLEPGICEISLAKEPGLTQQHGFFHGGLVAAIADSAAGYAAFSLYPANSTVLTVDYNVKFLQPAQGFQITARAEVIKPGKTLFVCKADVYAEEAGDKTHCLTGLFTMMCLLGKQDKANLGREKAST